MTAPALPTVPIVTWWRERGDPLVGPTAHGPLTGLTVAVKDVFAVAGHRVGGGNPTRLAEAPVEHRHAAAVEALLAAGASVAGLARTDELAFSVAGVNAHDGAPPNPAAPGRVPGGSSSGPASAVAAGEADVGLGTDTAGSVRVPASYQGLVGLRTTHGVLDRRGMAPLAPSFDTVGWLARDAATLARVADALLPATAPVPARTGLRWPVAASPVDPAVRAAVDGAVDRLVADGVLDRVGPAELDPELLAATAPAFRLVQAAEAWAAHGAWIEAHPGALGPEIAERFAIGRAARPADVDAARTVLARAAAAVTGLLTPGTVLLAPTTGGAAPPLGAGEDPAIGAARLATLRLTTPASLAGIPSISLPLMEVDGLPVGLAATAGAGGDRDLVDLAVRAC